MHTFRRDPKSGALLNTDLEGIKAYKVQRQYASTMKDDINTLKDRITKLEEQFNLLTKGNTT